MFLPAVLNGNYVKKVKVASEQNKLSRPLVAFFAVCQFLFGFNFGFVKSSGVQKVATSFTTTAAAFAMTLVLALSVTLDVVGSYSYLVYIVQYVPIVMILHMAKYTLSDFLTDLLAKDEKVQSKDRVGVFLWLYTSIMFGAKIATCSIYGFLATSTEYRWMIINTAIHIPMISLDVIQLANFVIFYHVYARLKDLRQKYQQREISLDQLLHSYKELADDFEKFRSHHDAIFVWGFVTDSSKWMLLIWNHLLLIRYSGSWWLYGCSYTWSSFITLQICVTAVFAEMISVQTDAMKMILQEQILEESDKTKFLYLTRLLRYVEARPLLRKAWRLVPVDLRQPISMLSICTTYLIVIIQFTHLYD